MKNVLLIFCLALVASLFLFNAETKPGEILTAELQNRTATTYIYPSASGVFADTITNTEADTILIPVSFASPFTYSWYFQGTSLSGTMNIACVVQESNQTSPSATDWVTLASTTVNAGAPIGRQVASMVYGARQRVIITGTGTQSTRYRFNARYKKL
jgi:hypothetical protein